MELLARIMRSDDVALVLIAVTIVVLGHLCNRWRALEERIFRSRMYRLRDKLRRAAAADPRVAESSLFDYFDARLSFSASEASFLSPYLIIPAVWTRASRGAVYAYAQAEEQLIKRARPSVFEKINQEMGKELYLFMWRRSPFATATLTLAVRAFSWGRRSLRFFVSVTSQRAVEFKHPAAAAPLA